MPLQSLVLIGKAVYASLNRQKSVQESNCGMFREKRIQQTEEEIDIDDFSCLELMLSAVIVLSNDGVCGRKDQPDQTRTPGRYPEWFHGGYHRVIRTGNKAVHQESNRTRASGP